MGFEYRVLELDGNRLHEIADRESGYRFQVNNLGAELVSVARHVSNDGWAGCHYRDGEVKPAEPCWGLPDHEEQRPFEKKLGIQVIPPQETFNRRFSMRLD